MASGVAQDLPVARNAGWLFVARLASALTTLGLLSIIGLTAGSEALGAAGVGFALGAIAAVVSDLGVSILLIREGARDHAALPGLLGSALVARAITAPLAVVLIVPLAAAAAPGHALVAILAAVGLMVQQLAELTRSVFLALQRMRVSAASAVVENLAWGTVSGGLVIATGDVALALAAGVGVFAVSAIVGLVLDARLAAVRPKVVDLRQLVAFARLAVPFSAAAAVAVTAARLDTILIATLLPAHGLAAAGVFFASSRLVGALEYVPEVVARAAYPEIARRFVADPASAATLLRKLVRLLLLAAAPWPVLFALGGAGVVLAVFGAGGAGYDWLVPALALALPARFLSPLLALALAGGDQVWRRAGIVVVGLGALVAVDLVLIPTVGLAGAVAGAVAGPTIVAILYGVAVRRTYGFLDEPAAIGLTLLLLAVAGIPAAVAYWLGAGVLGAVLFGVIYAVLTWRLAGDVLRAPRAVGVVA